MSDLFDAHNFDENDNSIESQHEREQFAFNDADAILNSRVLANKSYMKCSGGATSESEKEFEIFKFYLSCGSGRSTTYIAIHLIYKITKC